MVMLDITHLCHNSMCDHAWAEPTIYTCMGLVKLEYEYMDGASNIKILFHHLQNQSLWSTSK